MSKRKGRQKAKKKRKRLAAYKKSGKTLKPPLAYTNVRSLDYHQQLLPQFLWLESVLDLYGEAKFPRVAHRLLDLVDALGTSGSEPVSGLVESFSFVPESKRQSFVQDNREAVEEAVIAPFGPALMLYSACPMRWLLDHYGQPDQGLDLDSALGALKRWAGALLDRTEEHSNIVRTMVFGRYLKAEKIKLRDSELIDELAAYPRCNNRKRTESCIRSITSAIFDRVVQDFAWGDDFWATNGRISMCSINDEDQQQPGEPALEEPLSKLITQYGEAADAFFTAIHEDHQKCFPDPSSFEKTSVLCGLLARASALGLDMLTEQSLWKAEVGSIVLRCLCETLILLAWLVRKDEASLYQGFVQYSLGQQDLYGLKLEGYEGYLEAFKALHLGDDRLAEEISRDSWDVQLRTIDLGNWAGTDTRKMAEEGGTKPYYDLVFQLCSADVHSQFISLARWNMVPCSNALHNYHLLPAFGRRIVNPFLPLTACVLLREVCQRFFEHCNVAPTCTEVLTNVLNEASAIVTGPPQEA